jgi:uncharacterized membrane protein YdjX (TVP38/TMEM64 family)
MKKFNLSIQTHWPLLATGLFIILVVLGYFFIPAFGSFVRDSWQVLTQADQEHINQYLKDFGVWGPLVLILLFTIQMFLIVVPSWLPIIAAVIIYGFWQGILISLTGIILASSLGFYIGINLGGTVLDKLIDEKKLAKLDYWITNYGFWSIVLFRISPFLSNDAISFAAGMLKFGYRKFISATLIGITPLIIAIAYFAKDTETLKIGMYYIGGAGLLLYGIFVYIDHSKRMRNPADS